MKNNKFSWLDRPWFVSVLSGVLLGLSFPPVNLSFLSIPAFMLLFHLSTLSRTAREYAYYLYPGLIIWNLITTYWLMMASVGAGIAAILANSLVMTLPLALAHYSSRSVKNDWIKAFIFTAFWVGYEYLHHHWDLAWPWLALGNAWSESISLIQYISVTGHLGISFWVVLSAAVFYFALNNKKRSYFIGGICVFLVPPLLSLFMYLNADFTKYEEADTTSVTIIQPNNDSYQSYGGLGSLNALLDSLVVQANRYRDSETELIIMPENAIDAQIYTNSFAAERFLNLSADWDTGFLIGTGIIKLYPEDTSEFYLGKNRAGQPYLIYNSALYITPRGSVTTYDKANLVPIVERMPFLTFLRTIDLFDWVDWRRLQGYGKGKVPRLIETPSYRTFGLVCYDSVYPSWIREFVEQDASFITIITNDGWWGDTSGHHQHFAYARLRAIEFRRWVARSANNGISGIINPKGEIEVKTDYWVKTGFNYDIPTLNYETMYLRYGNWFSYLMLTIAFLSLGTAIIREKFYRD